MRLVFIGCLALVYSTQSSALAIRILCLSNQAPVPYVPLAKIIFPYTKICVVCIGWEWLSMDNIFVRFHLHKKNLEPKASGKSRSLGSSAKQRKFTYISDCSVR